MRSLGAAAVSLPLFLTSLLSMSVLVDAQYRLPGTTEPLDYNVRLRATLTGGQTSFPFDGEAIINVRVLADTRTIVLHANKLQITELLVQNGGGPSLVDTYSVSEDDRHFLEIALTDVVQAGNNLTLSILYRGQMEDDMYGWYRSWYMEGNTKKWLASTQFQATHARRALPCYDEPGIKVPFKFSFEIPAELNILFNTRNETLASAEGNMKLVIFERTPPMSSYLLAFVLSEFQTLPGDYSVWSRPDNVQQTAYAQSIMGPTVDAMVDFVGVRFEQGTIDKLDTVAVPDFSSGAMENWGLVTYREQRIQWEEGVSSERNKQSLASVVAHEIAHQWFGDLVSPAWWSYLWLNEGFATYFEFFACHVVEPDWRMDEQFVVSSLQDALRADGVLSSNPLTHAVDSPSSISAKFDTISYEKGGSVIRMMELFLGTVIFRIGLNTYMDSHKYGAATDDDLFAAMDRAVNAWPEKPFLPDGVSVANVMRTWVRQAGYPVITVTRNYEQNTVEFTQKRFLYSEVDDQSLSWYVPLTMISKIESNFTTDTKLWLTPQGPAQTSYNATADEWILVNIKQSGFYRVNYDIQNWLLIARQLETLPDVIPPVMRAQLVDDALNLARGGVISYSTALDMTRFLKNESDFIPWASALTAFSFLDGRLHGSDTYPLFQKYLRLLLEKVAGELGYVEPAVKPADYHVENIHRNQIATWACNLGVQKCLDEAKSQFQAYVSGSQSNVAPDMKSVVYCHGLLQGTKEEWDIMWGKYLATTTSTEQSAILAALGCSNDRDILNGYLGKSIANNDEIRRQDALAVFSSTYARPIGLEVALKFVEDNLDSIITRYGGLNVVRSVVNGIASRLSTNDQIGMVKAAFDNMNLTDSTLTATVVSALESARKNVEWTERNRDDIHNWLKKEVGASSVATLSFLLLAACFVWLAAL